MKPDRILLPLLVGLIFSSCVMTDQIRTMQIEIMRPAVINIPDNASVTVFNRNISQSDTCTFRYSNGGLKSVDSLLLGKRLIDPVYGTELRYCNFRETETDASIKYKNLSDTCVNRLINYFNENNSFRKVSNPSDSIVPILSNSQSIKTQKELFELTNSDVCIFLDFLHMYTTLDMYREIPFESKVRLYWTVILKSDSLAYSYNQTDTLYYDKPQIDGFYIPKSKTLNKLVNNSCIYLARSFGAKMTRAWAQEERMYYKSKNTEMLKAEKYAISQDWLKAAEIWNQQTKNKNDKIAAKACYNMALACEMEGKPDVAIAWLVQSYSSLKKNNEDHKTNCQRYVNVLALRKLEIERLAEQVNQTEINSEK
jgi:hypothetical protein